MQGQSIPNPQAERNGKDHPDSTRLPLHRLLALADRLPAPERTVLPALVRRDPPQPLSHQRKGVVWAKIGKLAAELGCSARTVRRGVSGLVARGILARDPENQLKYRLNYMALRVAAEGAPPCEGCGRPLEDRERTTKRHHNYACRKRALRRRQRLERQRAGRAAACNASLPSSIPIQPEPKPEKPSPAHEILFHGPRNGECHANFHPTVTVTVTPSENAQGEHRTEHGAEKGQTSATLAECHDNCPPAVTLTVRPSQNPGVSKTDDNPRAPARGDVALDVQPDHPELGRLVSSSVQTQRLVRAHGRELVARAVQVADLEYSSTKTPIRNPFGLIHAMCRDLDDTKLVEHEERQRREQKRRERQRRLRELQERGCTKCGFWQVLESGYCADCDPAHRAYLEQLQREVA